MLQEIYWLGPAGWYHLGVFLLLGYRLDEATPAPTSAAGSIR